MRALWDLREFYLETLPRAFRPAASLLLDYVREFDRRTQNVVDHFIANSQVVAERIYQHYAREATVIYPPVSVEAFQPTLKREDFFITCSRLVPYKRVDLFIKAFAKMPDKKLLVIGDGPQRYRLESKAKRNVEFLGRISEEALQELLPKARAFCFAAEEDFGIVMVEAQAAGIPVIAYGKGGSRDAVIDGETGLFFNEQTVESVSDAIHRFELMEGDFEQEAIRRHAKGFSKERFLREIGAFIEKRFKSYCF
jgi:glycosyltransferase involved in cell wall biosynthesis